MPAAPQNRTCQSTRSARKADAGRPSAPPMPSDALISAVAAPSRWGGSTSRMMLMPSGMTPAARPWSVRPTIIGIRLSLSAPTTEPVISRPRLTRSMRRFPYMSPRRPVTGVATAPARSVAVIAQAVSDGGASSSRGSSGTSGIMIVCISETTMPARASTATMRLAAFAPASSAGLPGRAAVGGGVPVTTGDLRLVFGNAHVAGFKSCA